MLNGLTFQLVLLSDFNQNNAISTSA